MKLKEYIKNLQDIVKEHGGELEVVFSSDDEGNYYDKVNFGASIGNYDNDSGDWNDEETCKEEDYKINAVCIN